MTHSSARAAAAIVLMLGGGCASRHRPPLLSVHFVEAAKSALLAGDAEQADQILGQARDLFPDDGAVRLWSAELASMYWEDELVARPENATMWA